MKKVLFCSLIAIVLIITLVGCQAGTTAPTTTAPTTSKTTTTAPTSTAPTSTAPTSTATTQTTTTQPPATGGTIKIGALFELTGFLAPLGDECSKALAVSLDVLGTTVAGKNVEVITEDTAGDASTTLDKARKLIETDKVAITIGPVHGGTRLALAGYLDRVQVPNVGMAQDENETMLEHDWIWAGGVMNQCAYTSGIWAWNQGYRTASLIYDERATGVEYMDGFKVGFGEMGGQIIQEQTYPATTQDFTPYFVNIKPADVLATWLGDAPGFAAFPQLKQSGNKIPVLQVEFGGIILSPAAMPELGDSIYGVTTTSLYLNSLDTPLNKEFVAAYEARHGTLPGPFAGMVMRSMQIIYNALETTGGDTSSAQLAVALSQPIDTVCGHYEFSLEKVMTMPVYIMRIEEPGVPQIIQTDVVAAVKQGNTLVPKIVD